MIRRALALLLFSTALFVAMPDLSLAADSVVMRHHAYDPLATDRIIVKWRSTGVGTVQMDTASARTARLAEANGLNLSGRNLFAHTDLVRLDHVPAHAEMQSILARLNADPNVAYAEPDELRFLADFPADLPNDPHFVAGTDNNGTWGGQWYLLPSSTTTPAAISATTAWQQTTGSASVVVAVLDTGIIEGHPDLAGKLQSGYDFVSCDQGNDASGNLDTCSSSSPTYSFANDGNGWDTDPSDPGDWISSSDAASSVFSADGCTTVEDSTWHGTKVAGVIGALTNNGVGIAGVAPATMLLPVRVLGKCQARVSDIAAAIEWASGVGVTTSAATIAASPIANIINISLAGTDACSQTEQDAVTDAVNAGVLIVVAAGNEGGPLDAPANCSGVLSVVGIRHDGSKVPYSNVSSVDSNGTAVASATIAAPGGNCVNDISNSTQQCIYDIETTTDSGTTTPATTAPDTTLGFYTYQNFTQTYLNGGGNPLNAGVVGTSFAAPIVSGVAALMLASNPTLTPSQLIARMQQSALAFPTSSTDTTTQCKTAPTTVDTNGSFTDVSQDAACLCISSVCGTGMVNAQAAVLTAEGMFVEITASSTTGSPGKSVSLSGTSSTPATGHTIVGYHWTTDPSTSDQFTTPDASTTKFIVPTFRSIKVILTITDDDGTTDSNSVEILSSLNTSGSGVLDPALLLILTALTVWQIGRRRFLN